MKKNQFSLQNLLANKMLDLFFYAKKSIKVTAPKNVCGYFLVKEIQRNNTNDVVVALYKNNKGQKAIAKIWEGKRKNYSYFSLVNETNVYKSINSAYQRLNVNKKLPNAFKKVRVPNFIYSKDKDNKYILLVEWVDGKSCTNANIAEKLELYRKVVDFIRYIGSNMTVSERKNIVSRKSLDYIVLYPFLLTVASILNFDFILELLKGVLIFVENLPKLLVEQQMTLVHRDLHFENILTKGENIYLIDMELTAFTYPLYEAVITLLNVWNDKRLRKAFTALIFSLYNKEDLKFFKFLVAFYGTQALTSHNFSKHRTFSDKEFFKYGLHLNNNFL